MNRITLILATILSLAFTQVTAQDFSKGYEAAKAGDYATAMKIWKPLALDGNSKAQFGIGILYFSGHGIAQNYPEAKRWLMLAANQKNSEAMVTLGAMYSGGLGVIQNYKVSNKYYKQAASQGLGLAQGALGYFYKVGENGFIQNKIKSHMWFNLASANGSNANSMLNESDQTKWYGSKRDALAEEMTASDISKAQAMAQECMNSNYKNCGY
ncbi:sel1 repeat family protein [Amylibacter sp.]|nr:sel1 repeat family protein [Amylibacter sp.]